MTDVFLGLIDFNEDIDYATFVSLFCSYLLLLWLVISLWVGVDAWRRFNNKFLAIGFFLLTLVLNFPILIFYFVVRPDHKYEEVDEWESQGVSVPIVNFIGKDGVDMVLELKMHPSKLASDVSDMKIDVSWDSDKENMELKAKDEIVPRPDKKISNRFALGKYVSKRITSVKQVSASYMERRRKKQIDKFEKVKVDEEKSIVHSESIVEVKAKAKSKKKKKRKKKKNK